MITLGIDDDRTAVRFLSALKEGHYERYPGFAAWTATTFEVCSSKTVDLGSDGESLAIEPPLAFSMRYEALRVRLSLNAIGESPARLVLTPPSGARAVSDLARGKLGVSE
jgi:hypothetical protein